MGIEENKKIAKEFTERMGKCDNSALDELCTEDFALHALTWGRIEVDKQMFRQTNDGGHKAFSDYSMTVDDMVAEGDKVMVLSTRRGTNDGEFSGIPPSGNYVEINRFALYRFEDGKVAEMWAMDDIIGQFQQLGYLGSRQEVLASFKEKQTNKKD
jgi:predicted ester cyclase